MSHDIVRVFCHKCNAFRPLYHITDNVSIACQVTGLVNDGTATCPCLLGMVQMGGKDAGYQCGKCRTVLAKSGERVGSLDRRVESVVQLIELDGFVAEEGYIGSTIEGELIATEPFVAFIKEVIRFEAEEGEELPPPQTRMTYLRCKPERITALQPWIGKKIRFADKKFTLAE